MGSVISINSFSRSKIGCEATLAGLVFIPSLMDGVISGKSCRIRGCMAFLIRLLWDGFFSRSRLLGPRLSKFGWTGQEGGGEAFQHLDGE
jgi:hypothetical protein